MSSSAELQMVVGNNHFRGFSNLLKRESKKSWTGRRILTQTMLWILLIDGLLAFSLFIMPTMTDPDGNLLFEDNPMQTSSEMFVGLCAVALAIGVIVMMQDAIIQEKQTGTAAWILSKPVSRFAFISAKFAAGTMVLLFLMILPTALGAYALFWMYEPGAITLPHLFAAMAVIALHALFYLTLSLLLGTLTDRRGLLLAVTFGSLLGGGLVPVMALVKISPWQLQQVALFMLQGQSLGSIETNMLLATAVWCLLFFAGALWQFERSEI